MATGITPSGEFHIGHLREILTGDMIARAARRAGMKAELVFVVDNADPLRKVYPFSTPSTRPSLAINSAPFLPPTRTENPTGNGSTKKAGPMVTIFLLLP